MPTPAPAPATAPSAASRAGLSARLARAVRVLAAGLALAGPWTASGANAATIQRIENGMPGTATFLVEGTFGEGDAVRMAAALDRLPAGTAVSVILESPGGHLEEGLSLGVLFHERKVTTVVGGDGAVCFSACAIAFLGGRDGAGLPMRVKMSGGRLGFHQFARSNLDPLKIYTRSDYDAQIAHAQEIARDIVRYLKRIGEDLTKLQLMLQAPSDSMNVISNDDCLERGFHILDEATGRLIEARGRRSQRLSALN